MLEWTRPGFLVLLLPVLAAVAWRIRAGSRGLPQHLPRDASSPAILMGRVGRAFQERLGTGFLLRVGALVLLVLALAGPGIVRPLPSSPREGVALMVALDVSGSMETRDQGLDTRLQAAAEEVGRFIRRRPRDRIGLVTFAGEARILVPPTASHGYLQGLLQDLEPRGDEGGTALGAGLGLAAHGLLAVPSPSRAVLLVTDGRNNAGTLDPLPVSRAARELGVRVHAVGVGGEGGGEPLDQGLLTRVARRGGGSYFRARDPEGLRRVMMAIDSLETGPVEEKKPVEHRSLHTPFLLLACLLLLGEAGLGMAPRGRIL